MDDIIKNGDTNSMIDLFTRSLSIDALGEKHSGVKEYRKKNPAFEAKWNVLDTVSNYMTYYGRKKYRLSLGPETQVVDGSGIKSLQADGQLSVVISPMPVSDWMRISGNFKSINKLSVYSLNGTTCFQMRQVHPSTIIDMSKLTPGLYIVSVQTDLGTYRTRIIKE